MSDKTVIIEGTMYWPFLTRDNPKQPGKHTFDLCNLTDKDIKAIRSLGVDIEPRTKEGQEERGRFITLKQKSVGNDGTHWPMRFKDKDGNTYSVDELSKLANGSQVRVKIGTYSNGFGTWLNYVAGRVIKPVWYESSDDGLGDSPEKKEEDLNDDLPWQEEF